jgi:hypothetical protein
VRASLRRPPGGPSRETEEIFKIFYKMAVKILTLKEKEERVRQAAEANGR